MKKIFLPFIVLTFVFSLQAQQTDWEKYDLKGKVKQVKATTASYSGKCAACIDYVQWTCITEFDTQGNVVKNIWYAWEDSSQEHLYSYQGEKVTLRVHLYKQNKITKTKTYHYKRGEEDRIEKEIERTDAPYKEQICTFTGFYKNAILRSSPATIYEYDDHGNWIHKKDTTNSHCVRHNTRSIIYY